MHRRTSVLGVMVIASSLAMFGASAGAIAGNSPQSQGKTAQWQHAMEKLRVPGKGCFKGAYPKVQWVRTRCKAAPRHPYPPAHGHRPFTVGNTNDYSAEVPGLISGVTGSFDFVTGGATETGQQNGAGPQVPNTFSLQINSKPFTSPTCAGSPNPGCRGWQQFIYSTTYNQVFIQYWLLKYNHTCPGGWISFMFPPPSTDIYCYKNSPGAGTLTGGALTVAGLTGARMTGNAGSVSDTVVLTTATGFAVASGAGNVLHLASGWKGVEFAIVGDCCGTQANFSPGTSIRVRTVVHHGSMTAPTCVLEGFTGETNNLSLAPTPAVGIQMFPTIISNQDYTPVGPASCAAAAGMGDTHLATFRNLLYDFQASGDFELATTGPHFIVQTRQVSGAPTWPNAAVNEAVATKVGKSTVAVCIVPNSAGPPVHVVINKKPVSLASGSVRYLPDGGDVSLNGSTYLIRSANGDSVQAQVNLGSPDWINVSVGLGRWPETVHGLLANAGTNPNAIASRGGTVLTAPFPFNKFYHLYGDSWRVPLKDSLLTVCGDKVASGDPTNLLYASNLNQKQARPARDLCLQAGVKTADLLDACTVDVAVLGSKQALLIYRNLPKNLIWGKITMPPFSPHM